MDNLSQQLVERLREVLTEGTWVTGTNFKSQITTLDWQEATQQVDNLNTIAALTFHVHYYIAGVLQVFKGNPLTIKDAFSFDAPPITSEKDWQERIALFCKDSEAFIEIVSRMTNAQLASDFVNPKYGNYYRNIDVLIEHTYYHLGQIVLIKKMMS